MKKLLSLILLLPATVIGQELATYGISTSVEGMAVPGQPAGVGNRSLSFTLYIDPEDMDAANELFYRHLEILLGPDDIAALRSAARQMSQGRR